MSEVKKPLKILKDSSLVERLVKQAIIKVNPEVANIKWDDFELMISADYVSDNTVGVVIAFKPIREIINRYQLKVPENTVYYRNKEAYTPSDSTILCFDRFNLPLILLSDLLAYAGYKSTYNNLDEYNQAIESLREYPWIVFEQTDKVINSKKGTREFRVKSSLDTSNLSRCSVQHSVLTPDKDYNTESGNDYYHLDNDCDVSLFLLDDEVVIRFDPTAVEKDPLDELNTDLDMDTANLIKPPGTYKLEMPELRGGILHIYNDEIYAND